MSMIQTSKQFEATDTYAFTVFHCNIFSWESWGKSFEAVLGQRIGEEFLSEDDVVAEGLAIARLTVGEMSAETMLQWLQRARPEALRSLVSHGGAEADNLTKC